MSSWGILAFIGDTFDRGWELAKDLGVLFGIVSLVLICIGIITVFLLIVLEGITNTVESNPVLLDATILILGGGVVLVFVLGLISKASEEWI